MLSIDGLVTGIDTAGIIDSLLSVQQTQIDRFDARKQELNDQKLAVNGIEARLLTLQSSLTQLTRVADNSLERKLIATSDEDILTAAVSNTAATGDYQVTVQSLAQSHQIVSNSYTSPQSVVTDGELSLRVGDGSEIKIGIDDSNNTLEGLARTINDSNSDVTASIIKVGEDDHKLLLASRKTGAANEIQVSFVASGAAGTEPTFDTGNPVQAAADATVVIGSGAGAIEVKDTDNQIDELFAGITFNLRQANPDQQITISVTNDTETAAEAIQGFVDSYNDLTTYVNEQTAFDPATSTASTLFSNRTVSTIKDDLALAVTSVVPGVKSELNRLSAIGISIDSQGQLRVNASKLDSALSGQNGDAGVQELLQLFGTRGNSTNQNVRFLVASDNTIASEVTNDGSGPKLQPYQVNILGAAEKANINASSDLAASIVIDGTNDQFAMTVDKGIETSILLQHGTYTQEEIASHIQSTINESNTSGRRVSVTLDANRLQLTSDTYGSSSEVSLGGGTALTTLGFDPAVSDFGQDVVGEFVVTDPSAPGGTRTERATGRGQILTGASEDPENPGKTEGLQVLVSLTQSQIASYSSSPAQITITRGVATKVNEAITSIIDAADGDLARIINTFDESIDSIDVSISRLNAQFEARRESLAEQFARLETIVGELQSAGGFVSTQLTSLPNFSR